MNSDLVRALARDTTRQLAVGDVSSTRTVYAVVLALLAIGVVLFFIAAWLIRQTRPDPELLAPLERMDDRSWRKQNPAEKRRSLDDQRPAGAKPVVREKGVPEIDAEFEQSKPAVANFDDLQAQRAAEQRRHAARDPLLPGADDQAAASNGDDSEVRADGPDESEPDAGDADADGAADADADVDPLSLSDDD